MSVFRLEPLTEGHDRAGFNCGIEPLNRYLKEIARQHEAKGISKTYVLVEEDDPATIAGYFTLTFCQIDAAKLPPKAAKKFPKQIPAMRLGRLAVSQVRQRQGIGQILLSGALQRVERASEIAGGIGLFVDAKDDQAAAYYSQFGFVPLADSPLTLFLPIQTIRQHNAACFSELPE